MPEFSVIFIAEIVFFVASRGLSCVCQLPHLVGIHFAQVTRRAVVPKSDSPAGEI